MSPADSSAKDSSFVDASATDLLGRPLDALDRRLLAVYESLKGLASDPAAPPCVTANSRLALAAMWQAVNDLNLVDEQLDEFGV